jgi:phosphate transport system permease protein
MSPVLVRRRVVDALAFLFASAATVFGLVCLFWILWTTLGLGLGALNLSLFTEMTPPPGA